MRRLSLAAVCAALLLAACQDNAREPLGPSVDDQTEGLRLPPCSLPKFPVVSITLQIGQVFPKGPLLVEALAREAIIAAFWTQCKPAKAQEAVASFVGFTLRNFQAGKIGGGNPRSSTPARVSDLIDAMLVAVQMTPLDLALGAPGTKDFGTGFADGSSSGTVIVKTNSGQAAASFQGNAFGEPTVVTVLRLPNTNQLDTQGQANQFAPFYDYTASNASNNHIVVNGELLVGFCLAPTEQVGAYPDNIEIGHNPVQTNEGEPSGLPFFEILDRLTADEYAGLGLTNCPTLANPLEELGFRFDKGFKGFASSAWNTAAHYLKPLGRALLPDNVYAFALIPRTTGVGGRTSSYSPFGVVEPLDLSEALFHVEPEYSSEESGDEITRTVVVRSGATPVEGVDVTFTAHDGTLGNEETTDVVTTDEQGRAEVTWLLPSEPFVYQLEAEIEGSSIEYQVAGADDGELTPFSCELEGTIKSLNSDRAVDLAVINDLVSDQVRVFWLDFNGQRSHNGNVGEPYQVLNPETSYVQQTFVTHPWILTTPSEGEICHGIYLPLSPGEGSDGGTVRIQESF
jgi:hypothetical protein